MRNPRWHRDEIILALDLYFRLRPGQIYSKNQDIIDLSELLNRLPIYENKPDAEKFRNANGTSLKLSNFLAIDPNYTGKGMASFSKLDSEIFFEFNNDLPKLSRIAKQIKAIALDTTLMKQMNLASEDTTEEIAVKEGELLFRFHKYRERNKYIVSKKKNDFFKKHGYLACELCHFDFEKTYGKIGKGFIECHHKIPLYLSDISTKTKLEDLMLVCSNCHRMLHRGL